MRVLDLFSGIGGFSIGLERAGMKTVAFCEIDKFCQKVLRKHWPDVPIYDDVRTLDYDGAVDVICGGFPCQDVSVAGKRAGITGKRSGLWKYILRAICMVRPKYAIMENVDALRKRGLSEVVGGMAEVGYDTEWHSIPASRVGALHKRERLWIVGYPNGSNAGNAVTLQLYNTKEWQTEEGVEDWQDLLDELGAGDVAQRADTYAGAWGVLDAIPDRVDRLRALGNAVVPQIPEIIGRAIVADLPRSQE